MPSPSPTVRGQLVLLILSLAAHALGAWAGIAALVEILDPTSRGSFVLRSLRGPGLGLAAAAVAVCAIGAVLEATRRRGRLPWLVLRDLWVLTILAIAGQVLASQTFKPTLFHLAFAVAYGLYAASRFATPLRLRWLQNRGYRAAELSLFSLCTTAVLLEVGLRTVSRFVDSPFLVRQEEQVVEAMARFQYQHGDLHWGFPVNSMRHYDEEFEPGARATVAVVGDSFSFGIVPHHFHYTTVCERAMQGVRVHNLGYPGTGPGAYLHLVETQVLDLEPDLIVISLFVGNDINEAARWQGSQGFIRSVCDRRNVLSYLVPSRLLAVGKADNFRGQPAPGQAIGEGRKMLDPEELVRVIPWIEDPTREKSVMPERRFHYVEARRAHLIHQADSYGGYDLVFEALSQMRALAGDIPFCVMLIPDQFQVDEELWAAVRAHHPEIDLDRDQPQKRLAEWLTAQGIPYLDLLPMARAAPAGPDGHRHLYHLHDTHFNARGNALAGTQLAAFLEQQLR